MISQDNGTKLDLVGAKSIDVHDALLIVLHSSKTRQRQQHECATEKDTRCRGAAEKLIHRVLQKHDAPVIAAANVNIPCRHRHTSIYCVANDTRVLT